MDPNWEHHELETLGGLNAPPKKIKHRFHTIVAPQPGVSSFNGRAMENGRFERQAKKNADIAVGVVEFYLRGPGQSRVARARIYSRFIRVIFSTLISFGQAASHS